MIFLINFLIILTVPIIQASFMPFLKIFHVVPELALVVVIIWSILAGFKKSIFWALGFGIILDIFSGVNFGFFSISFLLVAFLTDFFVTTIFDKQDIFSVGTLVFVLTIITNIALVLVNRISIASFYKPLLIDLLVVIILNIILALLLFPLFRRLNSWFLKFSSNIKLT